MKKLNFITLLLTALFLFTACSNHSNIPESPNHSKYIYRMADGSSLDWDTAMGMPIKINLVSGKTTPVCIDPLCMHEDADCPFYECFGCVADGPVIFFRRGWISRTEVGFEGSEKLCTYNAATGEVRVLEDYTDSIVYAGIHDNVLYYYTAEFSSENDTWICSYQLHLADGISGKITDLPMERNTQPKEDSLPTAIIRIFFPLMMRIFIGWNTAAFRKQSIIKPTGWRRINRC